MTDNQATRCIKVDMRGQVCPSTLLVAMDNLNRHAQELQSGNVHLLIITDNREALHTIPVTAGNMGYVSKISSLANHYEILVFLPDTKQ